jgi:acyl-CoA thioesterase
MDSLMENKTAKILQRMLEKDTFSKWLGLEVTEFREGYCKLQYIVRAEMINGHGGVHGGIIFSAADSAFAFACNSQNIISVALDVHITFVRYAKSGDLLTVEANELHLGKKISVYDISTKNAAGELIAAFKGTAYRTGKEFLK